VAGAAAARRRGSPGLRGAGGWGWVGASCGWLRSDLGKAAAGRERGREKAGGGLAVNSQGLKSGAERGGACGAANDHVAPPGLFVCGLDSMG
jgi:hypothetical protein